MRHTLFVLTFCGSAFWLNAQTTPCKGEKSQIGMGGETIADIQAGNTVNGER